MSKSIFRVLELYGTDGAIIAQVPEDNERAAGFVRPKVVRNGKIRLGGVDSFWLLSGLKREPKLISSKEETPSPSFTSGSTAATLMGRLKSGIEVEHSIRPGGYFGNAKLESVSVSSAIRLTVAYCPEDKDYERLVRDLRQGKLSVPIGSMVDALEISPNCFMTSGFCRLPIGHYALAPDTRVGTVPTRSVTGKLDMIAVSHGIMVFVSPPKWSLPASTDLRSDEEILYSAEKWLARIESALSAANRRAPCPDLVETLRTYVASSISEKEREDIDAVLRVLSDRKSLIELLPQIFERDAGWRTRLQEFAQSEYDRVQAEVRDRLSQETSLFEKLRKEVQDAEERIATLAHREVLLRNETDRHEARLKEKIADAARAVAITALETTQQLRDELTQVRAELEQIDRTSSVEASGHTSNTALAAEPTSDLAELSIASETDRLRVISELASSTGLRLTDLLAVICHSVDDVPVLVGNGAAGIAADIALAIGGEAGAVVFCDPTQVSFSDLLQNETAGLGKAIDIAKANPNVLVPVALCNITNGPCEYWLPHIVEMRRIGRLPSNLALIASAGIDGLRVSVPRSTLRYVFPLKASRLTASPTIIYAGAWPTLSANAARSREMIEPLAGKVEGTAELTHFAHMLAKAPVGTGLDLCALADALLTEREWIAAWRDGAEHELLQHFINLGG
ncbi:hypothetical protein [Oryzibacter oryziterrae]|uniref:hypothetical protein n=1 Tax=Oryzibacter oryziterrae TaxID=2766474 RepID=UPI001F1E7EB7|nr:hypothetical protein [Oryzibacter oryziterrae]